MLLFRVIKRLFWGKSLDQKSCKKYTCFLEKLDSKSPKVQIIECDKIYHYILKDLGYSGTFGDILKRKPKEVSNLNEIWELHKLRNSLVHELKERNEDILQESAKKYKHVVRNLLQRTTA